MKKGKWKIVKFWDTYINDDGEHIEGWNFEAGYHIEDDVIYEDHFEKREGAEEYIRKIKEENKSLFTKDTKQIHQLAKKFHNKYKSEEK